MFTIKSRDSDCRYLQLRVFAINLIAFALRAEHVEIIPEKSANRMLSEI